MSLKFNMGQCRLCSKPAELGQYKACVDCAVIYDRLCADSAHHSCSTCGGKLDVVNRVFPHSLFAAIKAGDLESVEYLVRTSPENIDNVRDDKGRPVLVVAVGSNADKGNLVAIRLVSLGASTTCTDRNGRTALIHAAIGRHLNVKLAELLQSSVDCCDCDGKTALMFAAEGQSSTNGRTGSMSTAKLLVSMGADLMACSKRDRTALGYAIDSNDTGTNGAMVEYLEREMVQQQALAVFKELYRYQFDSKGKLDYTQQAKHTAKAGGTDNGCEDKEQFSVQEIDGAVGEIVSGDDDDEDGDDSVSVANAPVKRAGRLNAARADAKVSTIRRNIEKVFGLPEGSVALCSPSKSPLKGNALIKTLRLRWKED